MAYVSKELKTKAVANLKQVFAGKNVKYSVSVKNYSTLCLTIRSGDIDFIGHYNEKIITENRCNFNGKRLTLATESLEVNQYQLDKQFSGELLDLLKAAEKALRTEDYFDESDSQSDYFHISHYICIRIGDYNKPYVLTA